MFGGKEQPVTSSLQYFHENFSSVLKEINGDSPPPFIIVAGGEHDPNSIQQGTTITRKMEVCGR